MRFLITVLCVSSVWGYRHFQDEIPNGGSVPHPCKAKYTWRGVGHMNPLGGGDQNPFGLDFKNAGNTWTKTLCERDSDRDGKTNGEELGDPNCVWTKGSMPAETLGISHPGVCTPYSDPACQAANAWVECEADEGFHCDAIQEVGMKNITFRFPETVIPTESKINYCMMLDLPTDGDYHLLASTPFINNKEAVHKILLYGCEETTVNPLIKFPMNSPMSCGTDIRLQCNVLLGKLTEGLHGDCVNKDFGFRIGQNGFRKAMMQIQWHNHNTRPDWKDSSGMTLHYTTNRRQNDASIITIGQKYLAIPPETEVSQVEGRCSGECSSKKITSTVYITRAYNHMHSLGRKQRFEQYRNGLKLRDIANDVMYSYGSPAIHEFQNPIELRPGDELRTTCTYNSLGKTMTTFQGSEISDETCFSFLTFYPAENMKFPYCVQWKEIDMSKLTDLRHDFPVINGCNVHNFQNVTHPDFQEIYSNVLARCKSFGSCLKECKEYTANVLSKHACLQGDLLAMFKHSTKSSRDIEYMKFWGAFESCKSMKTCKCKDPSSINHCPQPVPVSTGGIGSVTASMFIFVSSLLVRLLI